MDTYNMAVNDITFQLESLEPVFILRSVVLGQIDSMPDLATKQNKKFRKIRKIDR